MLRVAADRSGHRRANSALLLRGGGIVLATRAAVGRERVPNPGLSLRGVADARNGDGGRVGS